MEGENRNVFSLNMFSLGSEVWEEKENEQKERDKKIVTAAAGREVISKGSESRLKYRSYILLETEQNNF